MTLEQLGQEQGKDNDSLRFHEIDWTIPHIPISLNDIDWIPEEIRNNQKEFPLQQISISQGTGRIVGYFDRDFSIFYIVLLDPEHNIQPSQKRGYQIAKTYIAKSEYHILLAKLQGAISLSEKSSHQPNCSMRNQLLQIVEDDVNVVYVNLDQDFYKAHHEVFAQHKLVDILEAGIFSLTK